MKSQDGQSDQLSQPFGGGKIRIPKPSEEVFDASYLLVIVDNWRELTIFVMSGFYF